MQTELVRVNPVQPERELIARAAAILRAGGLVAFPTETVYGLGANALDAAAVARIFAAKNRSSTAAITNFPISSPYLSQVLRISLH